MSDYTGKTIFANYYRGIEAVGGKLYFDEHGITFKSHAFNVQTGETRIEYRDMQKAEKRGLLTGMSIREDVIDFINSKIV